MESAALQANIRWIKKLSSPLAALWATIFPPGPRRVVIGQDTRESSGWMADMLAAGLRALRS